MFGCPEAARIAVIGRNLLQAIELCLPFRLAAKIGSLGTQSAYIVGWRAQCSPSDVIGPWGL